MIRAAANVTFLWTEHEAPFDRIRAAADRGFAAVERLFIHDLPIAGLRASLDRSGIDLVLFDPFPGDWDAGERGLLCDPGRSSDFARSMDEAFDAAEALGVRLLNVLAGNRPPFLPFGAAVDVARERLAQLAPRAADRGVTLLLEAINNSDMPDYLLGDAQTAASVVREIDHPSVGLLFDAYHVAMTGRDPTAELVDVLSIVRHVQIADVPGRNEPGSGDVDYRSFFATLEASGYDGWIGLEFHPTRETDMALDALRSSFPTLAM
jgi:hydroxypyruvate isomerase